MSRGCSAKIMQRTRQHQLPQSTEMAGVITAANRSLVTIVSLFIPVLPVSPRMPAVGGENATTRCDNGAARCNHVRRWNLPIGSPKRRAKRSVAILGVDPQLDSAEAPGIPAGYTLTKVLLRNSRGLRKIIVAVKPQLAFFEARGLDGMRALGEVLRFARGLGSSQSPTRSAATSDPLRPLMRKRSLATAISLRRGHHQPISRRRRDHAVYRECAAGTECSCS